jgi:YidC/Oxa1 family membrane protein insertase
MNKNFIIAMILSVAVMFIWSEFFAPKPDPEAIKKQQQEQAEQAEKAADGAPKNIIVTKKPAANANVTTAQLTADKTNPEKTGSIANEALELTFSTLGGKVTKSLITEERYKSKEVDLSIGLAQGAYFPAMSSVFGVEPAYELASQSADSVTFIYENQGVTEQKTITLKDNFNLTVSKTIINNGEAAVEWTPAVSFDSQFENQDILSSYNKKFKIVAQNADGKFDELEDSGDIQDFFEAGNSVNWIGVNYGYFIFAVISPENKLHAAAEIDSKKNLSRFSATAEKIIVNPGESVTKEFALYYGTKERELLKQKELGLEKTITFGWTSFLAEPLLLALNFFYGFLGNYGLAIILLTIVVKLLLWPLSNASYKSMNKMKALQPKIKELQEKYKDDKETLNKETMLLYQKENINPLGGCLPMFIQMPVYIALYYMIQNAVELFNAPFLPFWLTDLSEKDPYYIIPISLGVMMLLQTKFTPQTGDNKQAKIMMYTMPIVFTWISLMLPSGITLYWFVNTLLGIAQQFYINKKYKNA